MALVRQAEFAAMCEVSRKTVTKWKTEGRLVLQGNLVDVDATEERMRRLRRDGSPIRKAPAKVVTQAVTLTPKVTVLGNRSVTQPVGGNKPSGPVTLTVEEIHRQITALDWTQQFDWSPAAMDERARLAATCIGWEAVTSPVRDDGHWGHFQLRIPEFIGPAGDLCADGIAAGFGFELDAWDVIKACRSELDPVEGEGRDVATVRPDLLSLLAHPFSEHDKQHQ